METTDVAESEDTVETADTVEVVDVAEGGDALHPGDGEIFEDVYIVCGAGTFDHDGDSDTACVPWSDCAEDEFQAEEPTASSDRVCNSCLEGTRSESPNAIACDGTAGMVTVPAGSFMQGCNPSVETDCGDDAEKPYYEVTVPGFEIDKYEVTVDLYVDCVSAGDCSASADDSSDDPSYCNQGKAGNGAHPIRCKSSAQNMLPILFLQAHTVSVWILATARLYDGKPGVQPKEALCAGT